MHSATRGPVPRFGVVRRLPARPAAAWLTALTLGGLLCACGPAYGDAFERSFAAARRAAHAGRYHEAESLFQQAAADAERSKDRDEALLARARVQQRQQHFAAATESYARLSALSPDGARAGRARFEHAFLLIEHGDAARGWRLLEKAMLRHPDHGVATRALMRLSEHVARQQGEASLRRKLLRWVPRLSGRDLQQTVQYAVAGSWRRSGKTREAYVAYLSTARAHPYPQGSLTDDAYWHAAEAASSLGDYRAAIAALEELLAAREEAMGGSYERPRYAYAQYRIGEIYRDHFGDPVRARRAFRQVYEGHQTSRLADDAMWQEALSSRRTGQASATCASAEALLERFPKSRYRKCLHLICARIDAAARPCPDYLHRQLSDQGLPGRAAPPAASGKHPSGGS